MDALFSFQLHNGREVFVSRLEVRRTYAGHLEGSRASISRLKLKRLGNPESGVPTLLLYERTPLLDVECNAYLVSPEPARGAGMQSRLAVHWWLPQLPDSLQLAVNTLRAIDWDAHAETFDPDDF